MTDPAHRPRNVLVTGGAGFIGSNLLHHLLATDPAMRVVNLDAMTYAAHERNLAGLPTDGRHVLVVGDICDADLVRRLLSDHDIDTVVHLAAESHVDRSIAGPAAFVRSNVVGTYTLIEAAREVWTTRHGSAMGGCRFHHVSTDEVFGDLGPDDPAFSETTPYRPSSPYSASKAASDHFVRAWHRTWGLPVTLSNCSNNYGPRQHPEKLIPVVIRSCVERRPIPVYGTGSNVRDWLYVADHCAAIEHIVRCGRTGETYNVGGGEEWRNLDLVRLLCRIVAELSEVSDQELLDLVTFVTDRPGHDRRYAIDDRRLRGTGWAPGVHLATGLRRTVSWYLEHGFEV